jgi:creatinine amidohydrolase
VKDRVEHRGLESPTGLASGGDACLAQNARPAVQAATANVPAVRSRLLKSLTGWEVSEYLKRNDVIYVPVGPTEQNGALPPTSST